MSYRKWKVDFGNEFTALCEGKASCIALNLLSDVQVDPSGGRILIDNIDICKIGLSDLRSRVVSWIWSLGDDSHNFSRTVDFHTPGLVI
jgi:hypothetical protein